MVAKFPGREVQNRQAAARYAFSASSLHVSANEQLGRQSTARRRVAQDARSYIHTWKILARSEKGKLLVSEILGGRDDTGQGSNSWCGRRLLATTFHRIFLLSHTPLPFPCSSPPSPTSLDPACSISATGALTTLERFGSFVCYFTCRDELSVYNCYLRAYSDLTARPNSAWFRRLVRFRDAGISIYFEDLY